MIADKRQAFPATPVKSGQSWRKIYSNTGELNIFFMIFSLHFSASFSHIHSNSEISVLHFLQALITSKKIGELSWILHGIYFKLECYTR